MIKCPRCQIEVTSKFCTKCGAPVGSGTKKPGISPVPPSWPDQGNIDPAGNSGSAKICPKCQKGFSAIANYCSKCRDNGKPVRLQDINTPKSHVEDIKPEPKPQMPTINLLEVRSRKFLDLPFSGSRDFGREDFKVWVGDVLIQEQWSHISRKHFSIIRDTDGTHKVIDRSSNGTYLGDAKLTKDVPVQIKNGDEIRMTIGGENRLAVKFTVRI